MKARLSVTVPACWELEVPEELTDEDEIQEYLKERYEENKREGRIVLLDEVLMIDPKDSELIN